MAGQRHLSMRVVGLLAALLLSAGPAGGQPSVHFGNPATVAQWLTLCCVVLS
jgi:uncharacterized lipoprotein YajG